MNLEQYNFKRFQDGLEDILKNPWKKPVYIQDTIPTFPEESNDKDRTIHDLIKVMFVYKRLVSPYYSTVGHLCLNKSYFLKYVLETYSKKEEFSILFKGTSRLTSHQIYEAFYGMSPNNASFLLDRIDCPISVYTKLKDALESREELKFAEAIDECDISNILPALKFVLFVKNQIKQLDGLGSQNNEAVDSDFETEKLKMRYKAENEMTEKFDVSPSSKFNQENKTFVDELLRLMNNPNELLESFYPPLFCQYCQMKAGGGLNDSDVNAFEYIFHQPAFEKQYNENLKMWKDGTLKALFTKRQKLDGYSEGTDGREVNSVIDIDENEKLQTPQIVESAAQLPYKWELPVDFFDKSYLDDCDTDEYIPCFLEEQITIDTVVNEKLPELKLRLNVAFQEFIETLAVNGCIDNDYITKASFAHALTGRKVDVRVKKVKWKYSQSTKDKGWLDNICHIASELFPRYIKDKNHKQLKKFDQIKKVFDLDYDSLTPELFQDIRPDKFSSSYGYNADDFVKNAVKKFLNSVEFIKISIGT